MSKVYEALCIKNWSVEGLNGERLCLERGKEYTIGYARGIDHSVLVFSRYWTRVPMHIFAPVAFQEQKFK